MWFEGYRAFKFQSLGQGVLAQANLFSSVGTIPGSLESLGLFQQAVHHCVKPATQQSQSTSTLGRAPQLLTALSEKCHQPSQEAYVGRVACIFREPGLQSSTRQACPEMHRAYVVAQHVGLNVHGSN